MSDQIQELLEAPLEFARDGIQFAKKCTKRTTRPFSPWRAANAIASLRCRVIKPTANVLCYTADKKEFLNMCTAVGTGFIIMGAVGYIVKLIHVPINHTLVGGA
ncbi:hypothetical protein B0J13DRAFT_532165 [Dactylonectria estremocensis]|uniref:Protein transport protein Sec61 subunit gamma n=1 Tax=Dactylonectria estremocensis TaxID=1079267 RepID=A0A9P9DJX6_9HYPO|nr:hypothetical protein B0J13DRAFT_532165 [Dactylonectria estremocensis]